MRCLWIILWTLWASSVAAQTCRQALILALDVSGSVNRVEYAQQTQGLAAALRDPQVAELILSDPGFPVAIAVYEWSSTNHQTLLAPWTVVRDRATLEALAGRIDRVVPSRQGLRTAIGSAFLFAEALFAEGPVCLRKTLDVSGDGINNAGPLPEEVTAGAAFDDVTVNALVITAGPRGSEESIGMRLYYRSEVIHGPGAFAEVAWGYSDYARAMARKLVRELHPLIIGRDIQLDAPGRFQ